MAAEQRVSSLPPASRAIESPPRGRKFQFRHYGADFSVIRRHYLYATAFASCSAWLILRAECLRRLSALWPSRREFTVIRYKITAYYTRFTSRHVSIEYFLFPRLSRRRLPPFYVLPRVTNAEGRHDFTTPARPAALLYCRASAAHQAAAASSRSRITSA